MAEIKKYRKPININIGMVIFAAIFIYICICISMYFKSNHIRPYEVREGSLTSNKLYTGIVLREETVVNADNSGYINYYVKEGGRVANGDLVFSIDETGKLKDYLNQNASSESTLSDSDLYQLKNEIVNFTHGFDGGKFSDTYDFKYTVQGTILKMSNNSMLENIDEIGKNAGVSVKMSHSPYTGIVMYWTDGYENLTEDSITSEVFDQRKYVKHQLLGNELITTGEAAYKICDNEEWSLVIEVDKAKAKELEEEGYVKVRFMENQLESWGEVTLLQDTEEGTLVKLLFNNSMVTFCNERYLEIELLLYEETGLKIPNAAIVQREFFLIPEDFVTQSGENSNSHGIIRKTILEDGTPSTEYVEIGIYSNVDGEYYVDSDVLRSGDVLYKTDSQDSYTLKKSATLIGVYNMNKGYADFRQIEILYQNEEYAIVKSNTKYGLNVYDLIVQNASSVKADQFIYD